MGRRSVVGISTRYELKRFRDRIPGEIFVTRPDRLGNPSPPPILLYNGYPVSFTGIKRPKGSRWSPTPSSAEIKERVQLYLYSLSRSSCPVGVLRWTLPLHWLHFLNFTCSWTQPFDYCRNCVDFLIHPKTAASIQTHWHFGVDFVSLTVLKRSLRVRSDGTNL